MDNLGAGLVVLIGGEPQILEGGEGRQDGASNPHLVLTGGISDNLDLNGGGGKVLDFLLETVIDVRVAGGSS